jgi:hypothetical protein
LIGAAIGEYHAADPGCCLAGLLQIKAVVETPATASLLQAGAGVAYVGPVLALLSYVVKQWASSAKMPGKAKDELEDCRLLLVHLEKAWKHVSTEQRERILEKLTKAAGELVSITQQGGASR